MCALVPLLSKQIRTIFVQNNNKKFEQKTPSQEQLSVESRARFSKSNFAAKFASVESNLLNLKSLKAASESCAPLPETTRKLMCESAIFCEI